MTDLQHLIAIPFGVKRLGQHWHFKLRVDPVKGEQIAQICQRYPEVKKYITKKGKMLIGGVVHQSSGLIDKINPLLKQK